MDSHLMKMIWAVIRPERVDMVVRALKAEGFPAMTRFDVYGRGKQKGVVVAGESRRELWLPGKAMICQRRYS